MNQTLTYQTDGHEHSESAVPHGSSVPSGNRGRKLTIVYWLVVAIVLGTGVLFRFDGLYRNYPYMNHHDEVHIVRHAMNMFRDRTFDPHIYYYGTGLMNLTNLPIWVYHRLTYTLNDFRARVKIYPEAAYFRDKYPAEEQEPRCEMVEPAFLITGRYFVLAFSVLSLVLLFVFLHLTEGPMAALFGAAIFAFLPAIVVHTHRLNNDIPITLCLTVTLAALHFWRQYRSFSILVLASAAAGAACVFKPTGIVIILLPVLAVLFEKGSIARKAASMAAIAVSSILALYICFPGLLGNEGTVLWWLLKSEHFYSGNRVSDSVLSLAVRPDYIGTPALVLCGLAFLLCLCRQPRVFIPHLIFWTVNGALFMRHSYQPIRNLYPLAPLLAYYLAHSLSYFPRGHRMRSLKGCMRASALCLACCLSVYLACNCYCVQSAFAGLEDSRITMARWIKQHATPGTTLLLSDDLCFAPLALRDITSASGIKISAVPGYTDIPGSLSGASYVIVPKFPLEGREKISGEAKAKQIQETLLKAGYAEVFAAGVSNAVMYWGFTPRNDVAFALYSLIPGDQEFAKKNPTDGAITARTGFYNPEKSGIWLERQARFAFNRDLRAFSFALSPPPNVDAGHPIDTKVLCEATGVVFAHHFTGNSSFEVTVNAPKAGQTVLITSSRDYCPAREGSSPDQRSLAVKLHGMNAVAP
jgi:hypothetical protein